MHRSADACAGAQRAALVCRADVLAEPASMQVPCQCSAAESIASYCQNAGSSSSVRTPLVLTRSEISEALLALYATTNVAEVILSTFCQ